MRVLVTGATGNIGGLVARQLVASTTPTRALVRDTAKPAAIALAQMGVELVKGQFDDPASLEQALIGIDKAFVLIADDPDHLTFLNNFLKAAQTAKVQHLVVLSGEGAAADSPRLFSRWHWEREQAVKASGLSYTFVKPVYIMQNFLSYATPIKQQSRFFAPLTPTYQFGMVDGRDIAAVAVAALIGMGHNGKEYVVTGPEILSFNEAAQKISVILGKNISYTQIPLSTFEQQLRNAGQPDWLIEAVANILQDPTVLVNDTVATVTGKPPHSFEQFIQDNIKTFQS